MIKNKKGAIQLLPVIIGILLFIFVFGIFSKGSILDFEDSAVVKYHHYGNAPLPQDNNNRCSGTQDTDKIANILFPIKEVVVDNSTFRFEFLDKPRFIIKLTPDGQNVDRTSIIVYKIQVSKDGQVIDNIDLIRDIKYTNVNNQQIEYGCNPRSYEKSASQQSSLACEIGVDANIDLSSTFPTGLKKVYTTNGKVHEGEIMAGEKGIEATFNFDSSIYGAGRGTCGFQTIVSNKYEIVEKAPTGEIIAQVKNGEKTSEKQTETQTGTKPSTTTGQTSTVTEKRDIFEVIGDFFSNLFKSIGDFFRK